MKIGRIVELIGKNKRIEEVEREWENIKYEIMNEIGKSYERV